jgi:hypothetical protein
VFYFGFTPPNTKEPFFVCRLCNGLNSTTKARFPGGKAGFGYEVGRVAGVRRLALLASLAFS